MSGSFAPTHTYQPRTVSTLGIADHAGWRIKRYAISCADTRFDPARFGEPEALARAALPTPAQHTARPGIAFQIAHQGRGADYLVLAWWDRDNELPMRIWVAAPGRDEGRWTPAHGAESVCVWDLGIIWFEREAFVRTMIGAHQPDAAAYLAARCPTPI